MNSHGCRVGIIGTGRVGMDWHLPDIREAGGAVVALADSVAGRAARFAAQANVPLAFDDYRALLARQEVDVVAVCTPPHVHEEIAVAAFSAGKHVYLEKPPAMTAAEMARIVAASRASGRLLLAGTNGVYFRETQELKRMIDAGELGTIYCIQALKTVRRSIKRGWHRDKRIAGGGVGFDSVPHRLDLALYLMDSPRVLSVTARAYNHFAGRPVPPLSATPKGYQLMDVAEGLVADEQPTDMEDTIVAMIQFGNGCTMLLRDMSSAHMPDELTVRVFGTNAGALLMPLTVHRDEPDGTPVDLTPALGPAPKGAHVLAYRHLFECIRENKPTFSNGDRAVAVMTVVEALYQSIANGGREVRCD